MKTTVLGGIFIGATALAVAYPSGFMLGGMLAVGAGLVLVADELSRETGNAT